MAVAVELSAKSGIPPGKDWVGGADRSNNPYLKSVLLIPRPAFVVAVPIGCLAY
jgi:hypothetical protein